MFSISFTKGNNILLASLEDVALWRMGSTLLAGKEFAPKGEKSFLRVDPIAKANQKRKIVALLHLKVCPFTLALQNGVYSSGKELAPR